MSNKPQNPLSRERSFYESRRDEFLHKHTNRHLLIKGAALIGHFATRKMAIAEGMRRFGRGPFFVRLSGEGTPTFTVPVLALGIPCQS
ncbi:MAG: hypothetical protein GDA53_04960 [Rhodobacteraceae bacterium]|nr:hypothetical protein [Paracoccaceae bacterium]